MVRMTERGKAATKTERDVGTRITRTKEKPRGLREKERHGVKQGWPG
jgi:hypothetical protein